MKHKTEIKFHSTAAFVKNIEVSKKFYTEILEQMIELDFGKNVILKGGITLWEINPNHIILKKLGLDSTVDQKINRFEFYFETEEIDRVFQIQFKIFIYQVMIIDITMEVHYVFILTPHLCIRSSRQ